METSTSRLHHTSSTISPFDADDMTLSEPQFLKLEDVRQASSPCPNASLDGHGGSPPPVIVTSRPAKKRKSWGQQLPQPKTSLPPRKRAKTEDEKEQRRIERIKRNRAAAHNSRERKRQETETLAVALARANAELAAYRRLHGPLPDDVVLPDVVLRLEDDTSPAPSANVSGGSVNAGDDSNAAEDDDDDDDDDRSTVHIKEEPVDVSFVTTLAPSDLDNSSDRKAVSVEPSGDECGEQGFERLPFNLAGLFAAAAGGGGMVEPLFPPSHESAFADLLQEHPARPLDALALENGAFDPSGNDSCSGFSFEDLINESAVSTLAVDSGFGAA